MADTPSVSMIRCKNFNLCGPPPHTNFDRVAWSYAPTPEFMQLYAIPQSPRLDMFRLTGVMEGRWQQALWLGVSMDGWSGGGADGGGGGRLPFCCGSDQ